MRFRTGFLAFALIAGSAGHAAAHPHVFIDWYADLKMTDDKVTSIALNWQFDPAFSSAMLQDFDLNSNGELDGEELADIRREAFDALKDYNYFTFYRAGGKTAQVTDVDGFSVGFTGDRLTYDFVVTLDQPMDAKNFTLSLYDETFYIDMAPSAADPVRFPAQDSCSFSIGEDPENTIYSGMINPYKVDVECAN